MDVCCLNRPFDDLSQDRVYLEAEAILSVISRCERGDWILVASGLIEYELSNLSDANKFEQVQRLCAVSKEKIHLTEQAEIRASFFLKSGLKPLDSLHLALAETSDVDVFLTTDDRLLRLASKMDLKIKIANPILWLMEVMSDEQQSGNRFS